MSRLLDEHGQLFDGQYTIVKDYVRSSERRRRTQEMFVHCGLSHAPGHAQCDFGEAYSGYRRQDPPRRPRLEPFTIGRGGAERVRRAHYLVLDLRKAHPPAMAAS